MKQRKTKVVRTPGRRVKLTRGKLLEAGLTLLDQTGGLGIRPLATALGVQPNTIEHHFPGGREQLVAEVVRFGVEDGVPAWTEEATWQENVAQLFARLGDRVRERQALALQFGAALASDFAVLPTLKTFVVRALREARVPARRQHEGLDLAMVKLIGFLLTVNSAKQAGFVDPPQTEENRRTAIHVADLVAAIARVRSSITVRRTTEKGPV